MSKGEHFQGRADIYYSDQHPFQEGLKSGYFPFQITFIWLLYFGGTWKSLRNTIAIFLCHVPTPAKFPLPQR